MGPSRRPSAAVASSSRVHRSQDSHYGGSQHPRNEQQKKIVQVLTQRLRLLVFPSGQESQLHQLESDGATRQAVNALAMSEMLDELLKSTSLTSIVAVLQSQLFIMKALAAGVSSRPHSIPRSGSQASHRAPGSAPDSPVPSFASRWTATVTSPPLEQPPMEDNCARYLLILMVSFLRQSAQTEPPLMMDWIPSADITSAFSSEGTDSPTDYPDTFSHDLKPRASSTSVKSTRTGVTTQRTPLSAVNSFHTLNALIEKYTGRIIFHISASNWNVVFDRLRTKIRQLSQNEGEVDTIDVQLLSHSLLDRTRLVQGLNELSSLLVNMTHEMHAAFANPLRLAIWNWIRNCPAEFNEVSKGRLKMDSVPERVFDYLHPRVKSGSERTMWPALIAILFLTPDRLSHDVGLPGRGQKSDKFLEDIRRQISTQARLRDLGLVCALDICRAAMYIDSRDNEEVPLRLLANDIIHDIKSDLFHNTATKPFWDPQHESLDISLYADVLVFIFRFLSEEESLPLFKACVEPDKSEAVKICVVRACKTLYEESSIFSWQRSLKNLEPIIARRFLNILKTTCVHRSEVDQFGIMKRPASRPKAKRSHELSPLPDREVLILAILSLWRMSPDFGFKYLTEEEIDSWTTAVARLWNAQIDYSVKASLGISSRKLTEHVFMYLPTDPNVPKMTAWLIYALPNTLMAIVKNLLDARIEIEAQRLWITMALDLLGLYVAKVDEEHVRQIQLTEKRVPAFILAEIAFLVSLTSSDNNVSFQAAKGLRLISYAERQAGAPTNPLINDEDRPKRHPIYEQLGDPNVLIHSRVGHQKRIRKLLRLIPYAPSVHIAVWTECYWRWAALNEMLRSGEDVTIKSSEFFGAPADHRSHWNNLTLFIAALGGACVEEAADTDLLSKVIPHQSLPDQFRRVQDASSLAHTFVNDLTMMLLDDDVEVRNTARDALGAELSPRLYTKLLKFLEDIIRDIMSSSFDGQMRFENFHLLKEQGIAILKLMVESSQDRMDDVMNLDITTTLQELAACLDRHNGSDAHRTKIKFCTLCDSVNDRTEALTLRKDNNARRSILSMVSSWIQTTGDIMSRTELNMACLRTVVKLLDRLEFKPADPSTSGDDGSHFVTREFIKYSEVLLSGLEVCQIDAPTSDSVSDVGSIQKRMRVSHREAELRELVITGLSHLVRANTEAGFKQCLPLAYCEDNRKRAIFAHVFARVIGQGAKFEATEPAETIDRYKRLCDLVKEPNMVLAQAICDTCPASEIDNMVNVLLNLFNTRTSLMALLKVMITREVAHTENVAALFRSNSIGNRFLAAFARIQGHQYLRSLIEPMVVAINNLPEGTGYELDPAKVGGQDLHQNQRNVQFLTKQFLRLILDSRQGLPPMFREVCEHIATTVVNRWDDASLKTTSIGAFLFLRFISPAVVAPETIGIHLPNDSSRRGLMIIAKIIQNLANNILFGKEPHMMRLNEFLTENVIHVTEFLTMILQIPTEQDDKDEWAGAYIYDDTDVIVLHRFFEKHADKIGKELLSISKPSIDGDSTGVAGKRAWDGLCTLLVDLGSPIEVPRLSTQDSDHHREYCELMTRYADKPTTKVRELFTAIRRPGDSQALFALRLARLDVETIDMELLMLHIFQTLEASSEATAFDVIVDCTGFSTKSELPLRWVKYCIELIPSDIRARFVGCYMLNVNRLAQRYLKRVQNFSFTLPTSVEELLQHVPGIEVSDLGYPAELEGEGYVSFKNSGRQPAVLSVGSSHIRIIALTPGPGLATRATDIIPMAEVSDSYVTSTRESHEFIIRRNRNASTIYLSSDSYDEIVKAKGRLTETHSPLGDRFSRFSNVPATLLHVGMLTAYDLLGAVCTYLGYDKSPIVASKASASPEFAPRLTLDFISEVSATMTMDTRSGNHVGQSIACLYYLSPWIKNLTHFSNPTSNLHERSGSRLRDCVRGLVDIALTHPDLTSAMQRHVWAEIGKLDSQTTEFVLDELVRSAVDAGAGTTRCETHAHIIASLSSISVRGKLFAKLRKAIIKASPRHTKSLVDNPHWNEVATLSRICLHAGYQSRQPSHNQLYVPEIVHVTMMIAGVGSIIVRKAMYGIAMNLLQSMYIARSEDSANPLSELSQLLNEFSESGTLELFGLHRATSTSEYTTYDTTQDAMLIDNYERLARLLVRILEASAGTQGLLNVWRARWMSLVTSSAFQYSSMIQMRAFTVLGVLAISHIDDDFFYQSLVAFSAALVAMEETDTVPAVGILRALAKLVPGLQNDTRYLAQLFWMGVAFLQCGNRDFFPEAARLVQVTLEVMDRREVFRNESISPYLLNARIHLEECACVLDQHLGLSFDVNFSFTLAAIIFKGLRESRTKEPAEAALRTLIRVTVRWSHLEPLTNGSAGSLHPDVLGYFLALLPLSTSPTEYRRLLKDCQVDDMWLPEAGASSFDDEKSLPRPSSMFMGIQDDPTLALFVTAFISAMLRSAHGHDAENEILYSILSDVASVFPEVVSMAYEKLNINHIFANSSNEHIIRYVSDIIRVALQDNKRWSAQGGGSVSIPSAIDDVPSSQSCLNALEERGMPGLADSFKFLAAGEGLSSVVPYLVKIVESIIVQPVGE
ncbi:uncharacterized protein EV420DRAFT_1526161 [Desarmillaria tabescens]|uniref:Ras-GAP domain-containing protein n=1 Tax=Armillaria tabescens TaxID=1929756 RepID=A0AA39N9M7_ARMTA|nr:uncharacterized protein EV420DRAFT_1526161 [Desarmillaria tabescens]KAK0461601.1 hypothetical protein EV420DRAFT_1526161 [Desarmillaria tabescens]